MSETLKSAAIITSLAVGGTVVCVVAAPLVLGAVGFGSAGVANIVAGSIFAITQGIGATGGGAHRI